MRHSLMVLALLSGFATNGLVMAADEDMEAIKAECKAQAEEQGAEDIEAFVASCVKEQSGQAE